MRKKQVKIIAAVGLLAVLIAGYAGLKHWNAAAETEAETEETETIVAELPEDEMIQISFQGNDDTTYTFEKEDGAWYYAVDRDFPVDGDTMTTKLASFTSISTARIIENPDNLGLYGLENPSKVISVTKEDKSITTIYFGDKNSSTGNYYAYLNDNTDEIYLLDSNLYTNLDVTLYDLAEMETVSSITSSVVSALTVEKENTSFSVYEDGQSYTGWYVTDWDGVKKEAGSSQVSTQFMTVINNSLSSYVNYNAEDLSLYGLEEPSAKIAIDYRKTATEETDEDSEEEAETTTIAKQFVIYVGNTNSDGDYYVTTSETKGVYTMAASVMNYYLELNINDYLDLHPHEYSFADLDDLEVSYNGEVYKMESITTEVEVEESEEDVEESEDDAEATTTTETNYYVNGKLVDMSKFLAFYNDISSMAAQERGDSVEPVNEEPTLTLTFHVSTGNTYVAEYYAHDTNFYLVKDSKDNGYLINKNYVKNMIEALETLLSYE